MMEFQLSFFKSWKMMLWNCGTQYASKFGKQQWRQEWKWSVFIPIPKEGNANEYSNYHTIALISHASKECSKFSKPGFSNSWIMNFQVFKLVLEKAEEPEIKLPTSAGSWKKQESSRKTSLSALLTMPKPLTVDHTNWKILRDGNTRPPDLPLRNMCANQKATEMDTEP